MKPALAIVSSVAAMALGLVGCGTETPTTVVVVNDYPAVTDGGDVNRELTVYRLWYQTTLFRDPVAPGGASLAERTVPATDYAYAVVAAGWDPSSSTTPARLIAVRSRDRLSVARGDTLRIEVSDATFIGNCAADSTLSADDAALITQRIFPGQFPESYDRATCTEAASNRDGGGAFDSGSSSRADATAD